MFEGIHFVSRQELVAGSKSTTDKDRLSVLNLTSYIVYYLFFPFPLQFSEIVV